MTWTRALSLACVLGSGWQKQGQSLHRLTAEHYGFRSEQADEVDRTDEVEQAGAWDF